MIPPRLHQFLVRCFIHFYEIERGPRKGFRRGHLGDNLTTGNMRATDLRLLERKGLITYERQETMSAMWGTPFFSLKLTELGKEEIADDFARMSAEADAHNARLENPDPFGDGEEPGSESVRVRPRT